VGRVVERGREKEGEWGGIEGRLSWGVETGEGLWDARMDGDSWCFEGRVRVMGGFVLGATRDGMRRGFGG
jgi:hypothetical protein